MCCGYLLVLFLFRGIFTDGKTVRTSSHKQLHELIEADPELKIISDSIHALPDTDDLDEWSARKIEMIRVFAKATCCQNAESAEQSAVGVLSIIREYAQTVTEWRSVAPECEFEIVALEQQFDSAQRCYAPHGNSYRCYCE